MLREEIMSLHWGSNDENTQIHLSDRFENLQQSWTH